jgi:acyl-CoA thioester hydrolase
MNHRHSTHFHDVHSLEIRVRYHEIDGQGRVHNSQYLNYFERGRVEMLRANGISYRQLEETGLMLVVKTMHVDFQMPASFDDELELITKLKYCHGARIEHAYELMRRSDERMESIVTGHSVIACVDRNGRIRRLPSVLQLGIGKDSERT